MRYAVAVVVVLGLAHGANAETPAHAFAGTIVVSAKAFAAPAKTDADTIAAIKKQAATTFAEDKKDHTWTLFLTGYFKAPLDDMEYVILVKDLANKSQILLSADKYLSARGKSSASTKIVLDKEKVGVNKDLMLTIENKGKILALTRIKIVGEGEHFSGTVDFSDDDEDDTAKKK